MPINTVFSNCQLIPRIKFKRKEEKGEVGERDLISIVSMGTSINTSWTLKNFLKESPLAKQCVADIHK